MIQPSRGGTEGKVMYMKNMAEFFKGILIVLCLVVLPIVLLVLMNIESRKANAEYDPADEPGYMHGYDAATKETWDFLTDEFASRYESIESKVREMYGLTPHEAGMVLENYMSEVPHMSSEVVSAIYGLQLYEQLLYEMYCDYED